MKKGIISEKLRRYLEEYYPDRKQQIYAHVMSMSARALTGVLFTLGLFEEEVEQIIGGSIGKQEVLQKEKVTQESNGRMVEEIEIEMENEKEKE